MAGRYVKGRRTGGGMLPKLTRPQIKIIENFVTELERD